MPGLYQDAAIYDILHAPGTAAEVTGLQRIARRFGGSAAGSKGAVWLEPACGTGRYLLAAARRGVRCIGFDSSPEMVAYAQQRFAEQAQRRTGTRRAQISCGMMDDFARHIKGGVRAHFAFNLINTIRHLESDGAMLRHFEEVPRVLRPKGIYAVGLSISAYGMETPSEDVWEGARARTHVKQVVEYVPPERGRIEKVYSHLVVTHGQNEEHRDSSYHLRCYSRGQWLKLIGQSAMELEAVVDEDGRDVDPPTLGYAIWILRPTRS